MPPDEMPDYTAPAPGQSTHWHNRRFPEDDGLQNFPHFHPGAEVWHSHLDDPILSDIIVDAPPMVKGVDRMQDEPALQEHQVCDCPEPCACYDEGYAAGHNQAYWEIDVAIQHSSPPWIASAGPAVSNGRSSRS